MASVKDTAFPDGASNGVGEEPGLVAVREPANLVRGTSESSGNEPERPNTSTTINGSDNNRGESSPVKAMSRDELDQKIKNKVASGLKGKTNNKGATTRGAIAMKNTPTAVHFQNRERQPFPSAKFGQRPGPSNVHPAVSPGSTTSATRPPSINADSRRRSSGLREFPSDKFDSSSPIQPHSPVEPTIRVDPAPAEDPTIEVDPEQGTRPMSSGGANYASGSQSCMVEASLVEEKPEDDEDLPWVEAKEVTIQDIFQVKGVLCLFGGMIGCFLLVFAGLVVALVMVTRDSNPPTPKLTAVPGTATYAPSSLSTAMGTGAATAQTPFDNTTADVATGSDFNYSFAGPNGGMQDLGSNVTDVATGSDFDYGPGGGMDGAKPEGLPPLTLPPWDDPRNPPESVCRMDVYGNNYFNCLAPGFFTSGENVTRITYDLSCEFNESIGMDFRAKPESCFCGATLTEGNRERYCSCLPCPYSSASPFALDCSVMMDDPFVVGTCVSWDCDGRCNGTGLGVVSQPTEDQVANGSGGGGEAGRLGPTQDDKNTDARTIIIVLFVVVALAMAVSIPLFLYYMRQQLQLRNNGGHPRSIRSVTDDSSKMA